MKFYFKAQHKKLRASLKIRLKKLIFQVHANKKKLASYPLFLFIVFFLFIYHINFYCETVFKKKNLYAINSGWDFWDGCNTFSRRRDDPNGR